ncbi:NFYB/HAP3 family transcription factor subunit [Candidatus Woesearchaeota archaeon]|nr:NFYB/HAP3 family transcription factor subunit [Candidatus Woesearchaeota archaeon]
MAKHYLSLLAMESMLKDMGAIRVGEDAKEELRRTLEEYGRKIAEKAVRLAMHAGRRTVKKQDIELAKD